MRGSDARTGSLFSYVDLEAQVPEDHPLRPVRQLVDAALIDLSPTFAALYAPLGRRSIPPERLVRALLLQAFSSIRSERQLMEQLGHNPLFRWFVGLGIDDPVWDVTVFTKDRERLLDGDIAREFLAVVLSRPVVRALSSDEHFSVDGTLLQAWASMKSFRAKDGGGEPPVSGRNGERDFHGEKRSNPTHASTTDPEARLLRKGEGKEAKLCFMAHALMENRHGLVIDGRVSVASGTAERAEARAMVAGLPGRRRITLGADKHFATRGFVADLRGLNVTPHVAQNTTHRRSAIDGRTTRHACYGLSQRARKRIEEAFGWIKEVALLRRARHRGQARLGWRFTLAVAAYDLIRLPRLLGATA